ncbi:MAG TPA: methyltransferase domain-containing protein [Acidimicrobiales bacterium]|nr:methyltransferase domain-containing protein [Acidimicrobiales bacterium]
MSNITDQVQSFWDLDAPTYDRSAGHNPTSALELAVWSGALRRLLPPPPARVLDVGSGTGFVALLLARQGYEVTALDLSSGMLGRLQEKAREAGLGVATVHADAADPPVGGFEAVVERHLLWTLPDPETALRAWYRSAPAGRLLLLEGMWGKAGGRAEQLRRTGHAALRRLRKAPPDHHGEYGAALRSQLPLSGGAAPETVVALVESTPWGPARVERLSDVEWAARMALPSALDRVLGVAPRYAVMAH